MVPGPDLAPPQRQSLSSVYTAGERQGPLRGWGLGAPAQPTPLASFTSGPSGSVDMRALPRASHQHPCTPGTQAYRFQTFPPRFLPPPSRASAPDQALRPGKAGLWGFVTGGDFNVAPKMTGVASLSPHRDWLLTEAAAPSQPGGRAQAPAPTSSPGWCLPRPPVPYLTRGLVQPTIQHDSYGNSRGRVLFAGLLRIGQNRKPKALNRLQILCNQL